MDQTISNVLTLNILVFYKCTIYLCLGIVPLDAKNKLNEKQRNQFLPIMKALYKVMETSTPAPEDVNTLLVLTRDLTKDLPGGGSGLPVFAGFNVDNMGLLPEGDVIVDFEGVPHINTQYGEFTKKKKLKQIKVFVCEKYCDFIHFDVNVHLDFGVQA